MLSIMINICLSFMIETKMSPLRGFSNHMRLFYQNAASLRLMHFSFYLFTKYQLTGIKKTAQNMYSRKGSI